MGEADAERAAEESEKNAFEQERPSEAAPAGPWGVAAEGRCAMTSYSTTVSYGDPDR